MAKTKKNPDGSVWVHYVGSEDYRTLGEVTWDSDNPCHQVSPEVAEYLTALSSDFEVGDGPIIEETSESPDVIPYTPAPAEGDESSTNSTEDRTES